MNIKRERPQTQPSRLENEVILAVVALYVLLSAAMLVVHYAHPDGTPTVSSSTSPSHTATDPPVPQPAAPPATPAKPGEDQPEKTP